MDLTIVVVSYNVRHFLQQCLDSVARASLGLRVEVYVVDNASVDGSVEMVRRLFPWVHLMANTDNVGFSRANNQALRIAQGRYTLLLNPDTVVQEDTLTQCLAFMDNHPDAGGLGVRMLDGKGVFLPESKRGLPTPAVAFYKIFGLAGLFPKSRIFGRYHLGFLDEHETHEVDILSGAFMLMRKEALDKAGLLDERFFMYGEDVDLSYRIQKAGYKNYYLPTTRIIHYKGESTKRSSVNYVRNFYQAMALFAEMHFSQGYAGALRLLILLAIYLRAAYSVVARLVWRLYLPVADGLAIWTGMYFLKEWWEVNYKHTEYFYPPEYMTLVVPCYIAFWLSAGYFNGIYRRPFSLRSLLVATAIGTLAISAGSNFLDEYRFSKALILLGGIYTFGAMWAIRLLDNLRLYGRLTLSGHYRRSALIVGTHAESLRVTNLLNRAEAPVWVAGWVATKSGEPMDDLYAGALRDLPQLIQLFHAEEVIFCGKDVESYAIIEWMSRLGHSHLDFKIAPAEADFVLGSSSSTAAGELYSLELKVEPWNAFQRYKKRGVDVALASFMLLSMPVSVWFYRDRAGFFANVWDVLWGRRTWVSLSRQAKGSFSKPGVLTTSSPGVSLDTNEITLRRLDSLYSKRYSVANDLSLILRCIDKLDQRAA